MSVVLATVKDHKGYIDISSQKGHGTRIPLYFPITKKEIASRTETIPMEALAGRGESILVVDDAKEQRDIANPMLTKLGYRVTTVASGEAAVEHIKTHQVDLVVLMSCATSARRSGPNWIVEGRSAQVHLPARLLLSFLFRFPEHLNVTTRLAGSVRDPPVAGFLPRRSDLSRMRRSCYPTFHPSSLCVEFLRGSGESPG